MKTSRRHAADAPGPTPVSHIQYVEMKAVNTKPIIDEIEAIRADYYRFKAEELDFFINYDIKYRMGGEAGVDGEDDDG